MKRFLKYRNKEYFNDKDDYLLCDLGINKLMVTQLQYYNKRWYSLEGLEYGMGSVPCVNCNELYGTEVNYRLKVKDKNGWTKYITTEIRGTLWKSIRLSFGVGWHQGQGKLHKKYGFPYFWNNPKYLEPIMGKK
jgi:hypothetical protein